MLLQPACLLSLAWTLCYAQLQPTILADTNRDGTVDENDAEYKTTWTPSRGAMFLANIGDTLRRCPIHDLAGSPLSMFELAACHDASGDTLYDPTYAARLHTLPMPKIPKTASGHIYVTPENAARCVRLFYETGSGWQIVDKELRFNSTSLQNGIALAMDSREPAKSLSAWEGQATINFDVTNEDDGEVARDAVAAKVAPILTHHHLQKVESIITTAGNQSISPWQVHFIDNLRAALPQNLPLDLFNNSEDQWAQDFFEPGYTSIPGKDGPVSLRVNIRSVQPGRTAGSQVFTKLRGPGVGGVQLPGSLGRVEVNSGGNIETIPPYTSTSGVSYPHGRIIIGKHFDIPPAQSMLDFLNAQAIQKPLILETGWLFVGHVDEIVQFLPSDTPLGFKIAFASPAKGINVLRQAQASGHGATKMGSYTGSTEVEPWAVTFIPWERMLGNDTIDAFLNTSYLIEANEYAQFQINRNRELLRHEIGFNDSDVVEIPTVFLDLSADLPYTPDGLRRLDSPLIPGEKKLIAYFPEALNGVVFPPNTVVAPKSWGPVIDGRDVLEEAVLNAYTAAGMNVTFVDDLISYHVRGGEIHCATNTFREMN